MTRRLYHDDQARRRFEAEVRAVTRVGERTAIVLDQTAFYPEAGGQLGDHGALGDAAVVDTQELDDGQVAHVIDGSAQAVGDTVVGVIDWSRRRQHMAQHTAQHLLSGALLDRAAAATASARLGESALTIDVVRDRIPEAELAAAEQLANDLIDDDLPVRAWFPTTTELADLRLRRDPKVTEAIRVVAIGDFDYSPCGGTHCAHTAQLGSIWITGAERYKGMTRVTFAAARRARVELFARDQVLRSLAARFSCGPAEVPAAIDRMARDAETAGAAAAELRGRIAELIVASLVAGSGSSARVVASLPGDAELLRTVAAKLVSRGHDALLCAPEPDGAVVVIQRAASSTLDCGALWKQLAARGGGRGGGRAERAEGRLATVGDWASTICELLP